MDMSLSEMLPAKQKEDDIADTNDEYLDHLCEMARKIKQKAGTFNFYLTYTSFRFNNILNTCYVFKQIQYFEQHCVISSSADKPAISSTCHIVRSVCDAAQSAL